MEGERLEQGLRDYFREEVRKVEPLPEWWNNAISRLGEQEQRSTRPEKSARWKFHPSLITVPLSILLLVILVGGLLSSMGGMAPPPPPAPAMVSDGSGGTFLVWLDNPWHPDAAVRAQHVDTQGNLLWGDKGRQIASGNTGKPYAVGDGNGGIIVAWGDHIGSNLKRLSDGGTIWVLESFTSWSVLGMVEDSSGGAILLLFDRNGGIYAQRVSSNGVLLWGEEGMLVSAAEGSYRDVSITGDGRGGTVVAWQEKSGTDMTIRVQRSSAEGKTLWEDGGLKVASIPDAEENHPQVISDGKGNFIVAWDTGSVTPDTDVYVQKLDEDGNPLWGEGGILVCKDQSAEIYGPANMQSHPQMVADGTGGVIVTWHDRRRIFNREIFGQRISADGEILWTENGVWVWDIPPDYPRTAGILDSAIIGDGAGGATVVWTGYGAPVGHKNSAIYAQRLSPDGQRLWPDEKAYSNPSFQTQGYANIASDGQAGIIIGSRVGESSSVSKTVSVYAQKIDSNGNRMWGERGLEIQKVPSALTVQFIAAAAILAAILILIGVFRRNRIAEIFTTILPVLLGVAGLFSVLLVIGPFGYTYGWAYVPDTALNKVAAFIVPIIALAIGAVGISRKTITLWVMVPVIVFCAVVTAIAGLVLVF